MKLRCEKCEITAAAKWEWVWYGKEFSIKAKEGDEVRSVTRWLCPDCAGEFRSERAKDAFLRKGIEPGKV